VIVSRYDLIHISSKHLAYCVHNLIINIILFVLKVQPNTTYKLFARKKNKHRCIEKSAIVNRYKES